MAISASQNNFIWFHGTIYVFVADDLLEATNAAINEILLHKRGKLLIIGQSPKKAVEFPICMVYERGKHL